jgi:dTDP-4-amino-4,6-dideoxygalactose transaminase
MSVIEKNKLAINGGTPLIPEGFVKKWPPVEDIDREMVMASLEGTNHSFGPNCTKFEKEFAEWNGNTYAITTNSGTAALHMAVAACGCSAGDHVIVPAYSWSSSATCVMHHNCIPIFIDIDYDTMNIDVNRIEQAITPRTKAIIAVHLHGLSVNMEKVCEVAKRHGLKVIEDACQSHGARYKDKKTGTWGDCAAFSFNQNKCLCSGEGGMFVTDNEEIYKRARQVWSFGENRTPVEDRDYHVYALGWMYRNNDLTAAFGRAQLTRLDTYLDIQRENAGVLKGILKEIKGYILPSEPEDHFHTYYNFTSRIDPCAYGWTGKLSVFRNVVLKAIRAEGVEAGIWQAYSLPEMTVFKARNAYGQGCPWSCPFSEEADEIDYTPENFPNALKHCDTHFGMTMPLRAPNSTDVAEKTALGIKKVFDNISSLDIFELSK